jgi:spore germination protein YaaH
VGTDRRVVWYESPRSIGAKLALAEEKGMRGFSAWALGLEGADAHRTFKSWSN